MIHSRTQIAVVGGGLAGYAAAIGLAQAGFATTLVAPPAPRADARSTALLGTSVAFLAAIGVFERLRGKAEPLSVMRIVDDTGRLLRAPTLECRASEIGLAAFGFNALNADILDALVERAAELSPELTVLTSPLTNLGIAGDEAWLDLADGSKLVASLCVGADGRRSMVRERSAVGLRSWAYPQSALVLTFAHALDHGSVSTEFHTRRGPFTQVPLPGRRSSLVWVETPERADLIADLQPGRLAGMVEDRLHSILGAVEIDSPVQSYPIARAKADRMSAERVALIGDAAHVFPPIGAQGLNLGLRDAQSLIDEASRSPDDPGSRGMLARFETSRRGDVLSRTAGVDLLNRSLLAGFLPAQFARTLGLTALAHLPFVRHFAMREGMAPGSGFAGVSGSVRQAVGSDRA